VYGGKKSDKRRSNQKYESFEDCKKRFARLKRVPSPLLNPSQLGPVAMYATERRTIATADPIRRSVWVHGLIVK
jgi:hypothetical protein